MSGFLTFMDRYRDEAACIAALAELRWPNGSLCAGCAGRAAYQLAARPRVFECAGCGRQHSVTAGTVLHRTRTPLRKWFAAAWTLNFVNGSNTASVTTGSLIGATPPVSRPIEVVVLNCWVTETNDTIPC